VERTIKDVKPALQTNSEGLKKVLDDLVKQYKSLQDEMEKWKARQPLTTILIAAHNNIICRRRTTFKSSNSELPR